ncbi:MAG: ABC transporter substrate-binding protein [Anaerolineales bacterium]|nr:MAG: ABC transporter substrate-binding protein [Anaerolineales bacterium]
MKKLLFLFVLITLMVSACGPKATPTEEVAPEPTKEVAPEPTKEGAAPEPTKEPMPEVRKFLRVTFSWPTYIDPAVGDDFSSSTSLANLYDALVFPNADGSMSPWLAETWESSNEGLTWTFKLRQDVKFHDGSDLTASDVVYSFDRLKAIGEGFAYLAASAESATAVDDHTVEFTLAKASGLFVPSLIRLYVASEELVRANTLSEGPYGEEGDYGKEWLLTHDAGSGPYKVVEFPLEEYLLMEKNEDWWGEFVENAPDEVRFIATTETVTVRTLMANKELEITDQWQTVQALEALDAIEGIDVAPFPSMTSFYYMVNNRLPPTDDVHCRRAMAYAFDYDTAIGLEWPGTKQMLGPVPATLGGHSPSVFVFKLDLDKAREELAQCQYADEIDQYPVSVNWISEVPDEEKFALLFQANMAEIGIPVEVISTPWLSVVENTSSQETSTHIVTIYVSADLPEAGLMLQQRYHSNTADTWQQNEWLLDPVLDAAIEDALTTTDQEERFAKYIEIQDQLAELAPSIFIYDQVQKHAYQSYVDWKPAEESAVMGYQIFAAHIGINPSE